MTDREILSKAVAKAIKNGFDWKDWYSEFWEDENIEPNLDKLAKLYLMNTYYKVIIFDHKFAKAFWNGEEGDEEVCSECMSTDFNSDDPYAYPSCDNCGCIETVNLDWEKCLQEMVIEEEPIKYLEQFLETE